MHGVTAEDSNLVVSVVFNIGVGGIGGVSQKNEKAS